jgi:acetoin utilization protein AcuB
MRTEDLMNKLPATCGPDDTLSEAEQKMQGGNCAFLPVTAGEGSQCLVGMITDGDIRMAAQLGGRSLGELRVRDAMAREARICNPGDSLTEAEAIMQEAGIRCLPVVAESGRLLGVLPLADVAREAEREREALNAQISAAHFGSAASRSHEPHHVGKPT